jgi:hypothetical protein
LKKDLEIRKKELPLHPLSKASSLEIKKLKYELQVDMKVLTLQSAKN